MGELLGFARDLLFENELSRWVLALSTFLTVFTLLPLAKRRYQRLLRQSRFETAQIVSSIIASIHRSFIWVMAVYLGSRFLELPARVESIAWKIALIALWMQVAVGARALLEQVLAREQRRRNGDPVFNSSVTILRFVGIGLIWALAVLLALDNLGVNITTLIAGLGIGGVAIALAAQTVLKDLLGSLSIALDKPFVVGDTIVIDKLCGTVESIGLKTTRLRSTDGDEIVLSNADVLKSRIRNFGHMDERRAVLHLDIAYGTSVADLLRVNEIIRDAVHARPEVRFERCHLKQIAPHALTFEAVLFALSPQGNVLHEALHHINLAVMTALHRERITLAYPTSRLLAAADADGRSPLQALLGASR